MLAAAAWLVEAVEAVEAPAAAATAQQAVIQGFEHRQIAFRAQKMTYKPTYNIRYLRTRATLSVERGRIVVVVPFTSLDLHSPISAHLVSLKIQAPGRPRCCSIDRLRRDRDAQ